MRVSRRGRVGERLKPFSFSLSSEASAFSRSAASPFHLCEVLEGLAAFERLRPAGKLDAAYRFGETMFWIRRHVTSTALDDGFTKSLRQSTNRE